MDGAKHYHDKTSNLFLSLDVTTNKKIIAQPTAGKVIKLMMYSRVFVMLPSSQFLLFNTSPFTVKLINIKATL